MQMTKEKALKELEEAKVKNDKKWIVYLECLLQYIELNNKSGDNNVKT